MLHRPQSPSGGPPPRVSVVVPCYNYGHYLPDCVNSIISQPGVAADVLIMDDASTDGSGDVAEALAAQHDAVRVIRHTKNQGHIRTYNEGLGIIDGEFTVLISADDLIAPGALGRATQLMASHPSVGMTYGNPVVFSGPVPRNTATRTLSWSVWKGATWAALQCRRASSLVYSPEAVVRTSAQRAAGDYRPQLPHSGDLEMWLRIAAICDIGRVNGPDQALKRTHETSMITTTYGTVLADLRERKKAYDCFFDGVGASLPDAERLRHLAWRRMAREALESLCEQPGPGAVDGADEQAMVAFVEQLDPHYRSSAAWHELELRARSRHGAMRVEAARRSWLAARRDARRRLLWRRWRWLGT